MPRRNGTTTKPTKAARRRRWEADERRTSGARDDHNDTRPMVCRIPSALVDRVLAPRPGDHPAVF